MMILDIVPYFCFSSRTVAIRGFLAGVALICIVSVHVMLLSVMRTSQNDSVMISKEFIIPRESLSGLLSNDSIIPNRLARKALDMSNIRHNHTKSQIKHKSKSRDIQTPKINKRKMRSKAKNKAPDNHALHRAATDHNALHRAATDHNALQKAATDHNAPHRAATDHNATKQPLTKSGVGSNNKTVGVEVHHLESRTAEEWEPKDDWTQEQLLPIKTKS